jgi:hypothetical protein
MIEFKRLKESLPIHGSALVKVTKQNHIVEVVYVAKKSSTLEDYKKLDKEHYALLNRDTGEVIEIHEYNINENRAQNIAGIKRTFRKIKAIINHNFCGKSNELFITLTYAFIGGKPMTDIQKASHDFDVFIKRFRRKYSDLQYCAVMEFQANSAVHWHLLARFDDWNRRTHIYIDNNEVIEPMWDWGWTHTQRIDHVDNIGAYLGGYLASVEINAENMEDIFDKVYSKGEKITIEEKEVTDADGKKRTAKFVRNGRIHLYKSGTNIYRCSRSIKPPVPEMMSYAEAKKIIGNKSPDFSRSILIRGKEDGGVFNTVTYESYNLKRTTKKEGADNEHTEN